jgi:protein-disulfide isomerase
MRYALLLLTGLLVLLAASAALLSPQSPAPAAEQGAAAPSAAAPTIDRETLHAEIRAYLLENPEILREMVALLEERQVADQATTDRDLVAQNVDRLFDDGFSVVGGNPEGSITLVEFIDYQCGFCRRAHPEVQTLLDLDGDIRLITKEMPILGPGSELAARAAIAALIAEGPEAYARLGDLLMTTEGPVTETSLDAALSEAGLDAAAIRAGMDDGEVTRRLAETRALAQDMGISGTPTFVFEDRLVRGYLPLQDMTALVARLREDGAAAN